MEQFEFHPAASAPGRTWTELEPGVDEMLLNADPATGRRTTLQRWRPGAANRQPLFVHDYVEEIYLAQGDLFDVRLGEGWTEGAYAYRKPGMEHGPFRSEGGCLMFILCIPVAADGKEKQA
ncbi:hypothetical protein K4K61_009484 [Colletotrichum sp. SAR11_59]|uniref:ChrR-like cupin domain-containing protein n=1 Tax=Colletotrichum siamense TaxID=690259 RepID=A0A9P5EHS2_COLSI|nr:uncharacterized protein CGCS363_v010866 [Colletotrichum siamense]KAF4833242.1 hypothetical protein CGCTS75_v004024 [Colletotrichum tropicale]KAI8156588.1 hypothetical protein K4K50_005515 [Colletotrichum sp. SAR 10_71]KAI8171264.1 hypothetical protein KHU50_005578 [Colletotrichum sp. SAR 10_65]KAI8180205.1 hypothetical protein K4K51_002855 [Colletotrichum sp. SAR 10_75]KAI8180365.1 hypothetical protein K4K49_001411 [Colletotrichum sp. SAR 10_70]KAI8228069.1 hypothetical protein K4K54_00245